MPRIPNRNDTLLSINYTDRSRGEGVRVRGDRAQEMRRVGYPTGNGTCACERCWAEWQSNTVHEDVRRGHAARWFIRLVRHGGLSRSQGRPSWFYTSGMHTIPEGYQRHSAASVAPPQTWNMPVEDRERVLGRYAEAQRANRVLNQIMTPHTAPEPEVFDEFADVDMSGFRPRVWEAMPEETLNDASWVRDEQRYRDDHDLQSRRAYAAEQRREAEAQRVIERRRAGRTARSLARADRLLEEPMPDAGQEILPQPFLELMPKGGRVWSAEVEVNVLTPGEAAEALGVETGQYSIRPDVPSVVTASDSSVDAEVKVSCMRDGAPRHADYALRTYRTLAQEGAEVRSNCGHHVHIDATRVVDQGSSKVIDVGWAASLLGRVIQPALVNICASGFGGPRGYGNERNFVDSPDRLQSKQGALHAARAYAQAQGHNLAYRGATFEFRMPNGTLEPVRAHAYIAVAMSLIDFGERCMLDREPEAVRTMELVREWVDHARVPDEAFAARFMFEHLHFSDDSLMALMATALTGPTSPEHRRAWLARAPRSVPGSLTRLGG